MDARISQISLRSAALSVADLVLPRVCIVCGRTLLLSETHLCTACAADLPRTFFAGVRENPMAVGFNAMVERELGEGAVLRQRAAAGSQSPSGLRSLRSLRPLPSSSASSLRDNLLPQGPSPCPCPGVDTPSGVCSPLASQPYSYAAALFFYRGDSPYSLVPQALKYGRNFEAGRHFARMLGRELAGSPLFVDVDFVIPVPLHWLRRWRRGYNQAEVIARGIAEGFADGFAADSDSTRAAIPVLTGVLRRVRRTRTQTRLDAAGRYGNVRSAFVADCSTLASSENEVPRHLLLLDDVFTTGATLLACERALRAGLAAAFGPETASRIRISVATLAYVGR